MEENSNERLCWYNKFEKETWTREITNYTKAKKETVLRIMLIYSLAAWESASPRMCYISYCSSVNYCVSKGCVTGTLPSAAHFFELQSHPERPGDTKHDMYSSLLGDSQPWKRKQMCEKMKRWNSISLFHFPLSSFNLGNILLFHTVWQHPIIFWTMLFQLFNEVVWWLQWVKYSNTRPIFVAAAPFYQMGIF